MDFEKVKAALGLLCLLIGIAGGVMGFLASVDVSLMPLNLHAFFGWNDNPATIPILFGLIAIAGSHLLASVNSKRI